jgi:predicted glycoside hydrolase/deacetylase ChbG (UPF0249 family)
MVPILIIALDVQLSFLDSHKHIYLIANVIPIATLVFLLKITII